MFGINGSIVQSRKSKVGERGERKYRRIELVSFK